MGRSYAADLILTARTIGAEEALAHGLVSRVVPLADLVKEARSIAASISKKAPLAIRAAIETIFMGVEEPIEEGLEREATLFAQLTVTEDFKEGTTAFLGKRAAEFHGR
jgi:enoyl-CoA hydratase